jgi:DNA-binding NtrC family response regulator
VVSKALDEAVSPTKVVGVSRVMRHVFERVRRAAQTGSSVLLTGEPGTGKHLLAQTIHQQSDRGGGPFVVAHVNGLPGGLIEAELFGRCAWPASSQQGETTGCLEAAQDGTLLIDEIAQLDRVCQAKLLRAIENRRITPADGDEDRPIDVRIIAATRHDLERLVARGEFREDLYYRVSVIAIDLPPLRQRREDIPLLARHFAGMSAMRHHRPSPALDDELMRFLQEYNWPGNVGQLQQCIDAMVVSTQQETLSINDLPLHLQREVQSDPDRLAIARDNTLANLERIAVMRALQQHGGNRTRAAESLGISVRTLQRKLKRWVT